MLNAIDDRYADEVLAWVKRSRSWRSIPRTHPRLHWQQDTKSYVSFAGKEIVFGMVDAEGRSAVSRFLEDEGARLLPLHRAVLEAQTRAYTSIWEIERVEPGSGLALVDLVDGTKRFVYEAALSPAFVGKETGGVLARVVEVDGISIASGLHLDVFTKKLASELIAQGVPSTGFDLGERWERAVEESLRPTPRSLFNTDGDPIKPTLDRYAFPHEHGADVVERLCTMLGVEVQPICAGAIGLRFLNVSKYPKTPKGQGVVEGKAVLGISEFLVETNSPARADALCARIEKDCRPHIHHIGRELTSPDAYFDRFVALGAGPEWLASTTKDAAQLVDIKNAIIARWLDKPMPILDGATPVQAMQTCRARSRLRWMLDRLAALEQRTAAALRFDVAALRRDLRIDE